MRVLFIGTVEFSLIALKKLLALEVNLVGVCSKKESIFNSDYADLGPICESHGISHLYVEDINKNIDWIKELKPDIIFCFGWSYLIKKELLMLPSMGVVGYHPAHLPKNRGRHPLIWALVLGLKESASTFFFMTEGADDGDILAQERFEIPYELDAGHMYKKIIEIALKQIECFVPMLENKTHNRIKQDHNLSNTWRKRCKNDGKIDFRMSSYAVYNLVRGLARPYVGAHIEYDGGDVVIWKVEEVMCSEENIEPGKVLKVDGRIIVIKCYENAIKLLEHEFNEIPKVGEYL